MSLLAGPELIQLINDGVIDALPENINASSIDVRLGRHIKVERTRGMGYGQEVDIAAKEDLSWTDVEIGDHGYVVKPGQFLLAHTVEVFSMPDDISAEFKLRSSVARVGLEHMNAGWVDSGFSGDLTLEFKNMTQAHGLVIRPGMRLGQITFHRHAPAGEYSYSVKGRYNSQRGATSSRGV